MLWRANQGTNEQVVYNAMTNQSQLLVHFFLQYFAQPIKSFHYNLCYKMKS